MKPLEQIKEEFPTLFPEHFFFECGDGWYNILYELIRKVYKENDRMRIYNSMREEEGLDRIIYTPVKIVQIKEKWAGLRFYYNGGSEFVHGLVAMAEAMSYYTCEECGFPGTINKGGWYRVRCDKCREKEPQ